MSLKQWWRNKDTKIRLFAVLTFLTVFCIIMIILAGAGARVIGSAMLDIQTETSDPPSTQFSVDYDNQDAAATLTHSGGDNLEIHDIYVTVNEEKADVEWESDDIMTAGDSVVVDGVYTGDQVTVRWDGNGESEAIYYKNILEG